MQIKMHYPYIVVWIALLISTTFAAGASDECQAAYCNFQGIASFSKAGCQCNCYDGYDGSRCEFERRRRQLQSVHATCSLYTLCSEQAVNTVNRGHGTICTGDQNTCDADTCCKAPEWKIIAGVEDCAITIEGNEKCIGDSSSDSFSSCIFRMDTDRSIMVETIVFGHGCDSDIHSAYNYLWMNGVKYCGCVNPAGTQCSNLPQFFEVNEDTGHLQIDIYNSPGQNFKICTTSLTNVQQNQDCTVESDSCQEGSRCINVGGVFRCRFVYSCPTIPTEQIHSPCDCGGTVCNGIDQKYCRLGKCYETVVQIDEECNPQTDMCQDGYCAHDGPGQFFCKMGGWRILKGHGSCEITMEGNSECISDGDGYYFVYESCEFEYVASTPRLLERKVWDLEPSYWGTYCYTYVKFNGEKYCGDITDPAAFPDEYTVTGTSMFKFQTDWWYMGPYQGFKICAMDPGNSIVGSNSTVYCDGPIRWAMETGRHTNPDWYSYEAFEIVESSVHFTGESAFHFYTGVSLDSGEYEDFQVWFYCNPNFRAQCPDIQLPSGRVCSPDMRNERNLENIADGNEDPVETVAERIGNLHTKDKDQL